MFLSSKNYLLIIIVFAVIFFFVYAGFYWNLRPAAMNNDMWIFNTPDETAHYFFISNFTADGRLKYYEPLNKLSGQMSLVHPRSTTVIDNYLAPAQFLGFILIEGVIAKIFSVNVVPFIIPFFSVLAVICFYLIIKEIFSKEIAFFSALALLVMPAFWYYSARSLFNNILFIDFLIIGSFWLMRFLARKGIVNLILAAIFIGLALTIRTSDIFWVGPVVILLFFWNRRQISRRYFLFLFFVSAAVFIPVLIFQNFLFGNPFITGYTPRIAVKMAGGNWLAQLFQYFILPFGFNFKNIIYNLYHYFIRMFWWYFWPSFLGALLILYHWSIKRLDKKIKLYFLIFILISLAVSVYYGSWRFYNNLLAKALIGSSQARYLLPVYILAIPLAIYFFSRLLAVIKSHGARVVTGGVTAVVIVFLSLNAVLWRGEESLMAVKVTVQDYHQINKTVRSLTEENSVMVTSYNDKVFFPKRRVIFYWQEPKYLENIELLMAQAPIYFYSIDSGREINYIIDNSDLQLELVKKINNSEGLYKLVY